MTMIFMQVFATAVISLQWIIVYTYVLASGNDSKSFGQQPITFFVYRIALYCYYLNNVKSFYVSMLTSQLFRQTFTKGLIKCLPRHEQRQFAQPRTTGLTVTVTKTKR
jgi:ammonia channel protein AmtB